MASPSSSPARSSSSWSSSLPNLQNLNPVYVSSVQLLDVSFFIHQSELTWAGSRVTGSKCRLQVLGPTLHITVANKGQASTGIKEGTWFHRFFSIVLPLCISLTFLLLSVYSISFLLLKVITDTTELRSHSFLT